MLKKLQRDEPKLDEVSLVPSGAVFLGTLWASALPSSPWSLSTRGVWRRSAIRSLMQSWTRLTADPYSKVACETATKDNMVKFEYDGMVRKAVLGIGYDSFVVYLSAVDPKGLSYKTCKVSVRINKQSPDIAGGMHVGESVMDKMTSMVAEALMVA